MLKNIKNLKISESHSFKEIRHSLLFMPPNTAHVINSNQMFFHYLSCFS